MDAIKFVSLMSANTDFIYEALAAYLAPRIGIPVEVVSDVPWRERERLLDAGRVQMGVICGLPYTRKADQPVPPIRLLAAAVMQAERYQGRPIYFSDVVVRRDSCFRSFADLRGASWAYNEPNSHSGYSLTRSWLARLGETAGYFGRVVESGAHQTSLRMVVEGLVDASAIDSIVLEIELARHPELASQVRVIETLGPSPIPPMIVSTGVPDELERTLRQRFVRMHEGEEGRAVLSVAAMARFVEVADSDYDEIRVMAREAEAATLGGPQCREGTMPFSAAS